MRFDARVDHEVLLKMSQLLEGFTTGTTILVLHIATVGSHLSVCSVVHSQVAELAKPLVTFRALVNHPAINFLTPALRFLCTQNYNLRIIRLNL